ncbi:MAG: antitoxin family protein [Terriglobia bacterium]
MTKIIEAIFDGVALRPDEPLELPPNTRVRLTIESPTPPGTPGSFLRTARALALSGPRDWSANIETYLYGQKAHPER